MKPYLFALSASLAGFALSAAAQQPAPASPAASGQQVVVLRNGSSLQGEVFSLGDYYRVKTETTEVRLAARDVERIAPTLLHAYDARRAERKEWQADDHLRMAAWCIRQELWPQAAREINDARVLEPQHPALATFDHRLMTAARAAERRAQGVAEPAEDVVSEAEKAEAEERAAMAALAQSLPEGSLEEFTRSIQPLLVNNCSLAGCHSMQDEREFRLNRDLLHGMANRRSTFRNLQAVLAQIDKENVEASPLVTMSAQGHGGMVQPPFRGHREKLHTRLVDWTYKAAGQSRVVPAAAELPIEGVPADGMYPEGTPAEEGAIDPLDVPLEELARNGGATPMANRPTRARRPAAEEKHFWEIDGDGNAIEATLQRGTKAKRYTPRDDFDPEIFNRQHREEQAPTAARQSAAVEVER